MQQKDLIDLCRFRNIVFQVTPRLNLQSDLTPTATIVDSDSRFNPVNSPGSTQFIRDLTRPLFWLYKVFLFGQMMASVSADKQKAELQTVCWNHLRCATSGILAAGLRSHELREEPEPDGNDSAGGQAHRDPREEVARDSSKTD